MSTFDPHDFIDFDWHGKSPDRVKSKWHEHDIMASAVEESCYFCSYPASHKVRDDEVTYTHPYTAYVCCNHFWAGCRNIKEGY